MQEFILFVLTFFVVLFVYEIFIVSRAKKGYKANKRKDPVEVVYLVSHYKLDLKKISYNQLLQIIALVSSFDIAFIVSIILWLPSYILRIILGFVFTLMIILFSYHLVYLFYKKKGMITK